MGFDHPKVVAVRTERIVDLGPKDPETIAIEWKPGVMFSADRELHIHNVTPTVPKIDARHHSRTCIGSSVCDGAQHDFGDICG